MRVRTYQPVRRPMINPLQEQRRLTSLSNHTRADKASTVPTRERPPATPTLRMHSPSASSLVERHEFLPMHFQRLGEICAYQAWRFRLGLLKYGVKGDPRVDLAVAER